jgi:hypothetical protein
MFAGLTNAMADINRFTASNSTYGVLGYMDFDSSIFDTSLSTQFIDNDLMMSLDFTNPTNSFHITTIGPSGKGTYFDSTGSLPSVLAGFGQQGGTSFSDQVTIVVGSGFGDPSNLILGNGTGNNLFSGVSWTASVVAAIPEPETYAMLLAGLGLLGWHARRRKNKQIS